LKTYLFKNAFKLLSYNTFIPLAYDPLMYMIKRDRQRALDAMSFNESDNVFLPGIGMGNDLPYFANNVNHITGIDISDVMLSGASLRAKNLHLTNVELKVMDAESLEYPDNHFDKAVLTLFLTVAFDPKKVFAEVVRVLKPGGEILIFDHFVKQGAFPAPILKTIDAFMRVAFTSIARVFEDIIQDQRVTIIQELSSKTPGFKVYVLKKDVIPQ
jgi:phosphatidylethanolamine/phosphatidyl-N-methylethanolamine N-methyltransferase